MENKIMKNAKLHELPPDQMINTHGGSWFAFVAGAIAGGIIYDAWKASLNGYVSGCMNGSIDPAIRPSR